MIEEKKAALIKPYNYRGHLDFLLENVSIDDFYVKKQVYDLVFADVALFFVKFNKNETRKYYKLKPERLLVKTCILQIDGLSIPVQIDFSLLQ